jgi:hypothetical protein
MYAKHTYIYLYIEMASPGFPPADLPATPAQLILAGTGFARL